MNDPNLGLIAKNAGQGGANRAHYFWKMSQQFILLQALSIEQGQCGWELLNFSSCLIKGSPLSRFRRPL